MKKFKLREYFEVYSKKSGMVQKSFLYEQTFDTTEQALDFFRSKWPDGKLKLNENGMSGTMYRYPNGVASHKPFKITTTKI